MTLSIHESDYLKSWRATLRRRADQAVELLSTIPAVRGLVLAGGLGREAEWPLSDIDLIGIYSASAYEQTKADVDRVRTTLMAMWSEEGFLTSLDIKGIVYSDREIAAAITTTGSAVVPLLSDKRFYHGMDKAHGGQAPYDPESLGSEFLTWVSQERYSADVTAARVQEKRRIRDLALQQAQEKLENKAEVIAASMAVDSAVVAHVHLLMEIWGDRGSARRGPTFSERRAAEKGEESVVSQLLKLRRFDVASCRALMASTPEQVWHYSDLSLRARRLVSEEVTEGQNMRDAVVWEAGRVFREEKPPYDEWVGVDDDHASVESRLGALKELRDSHHLLRSPS